MATQKLPPPPPRNSAYFPHIDGIRTLAIIPVLLYHLCSTLCPGGYAGVDVFFVISGYLITGGILRDLKNNQFSLVNFYHRRVKRIIPAYSVLILFVIAVGIVLFNEEQLKTLAGTSFFSSFFSTNIYFWGKSGYFDGNAHENPLLNLWSLGVEEQFYIILPLSLLLLWKAKRSILLPALIIGFILSFVLALYSMYMSNVLDSFYLLPQRIKDLLHGASFFLLPQRAWELLAGSLLAFSPIVILSSRIKSGLVILIGWGLILFPYVFYDVSTQFPGITAIPSVLGTVLLIKFGANFWSKKILESRVFVGIGKISYSLYLWHWPIIVYWTYCYLGEKSLIDYLGIVILSFIMAYVSWRFIETPIRKNKSFSPVITLLATFLICLSIGFISLFLEKSSWVKNVFYPQSNQYYAKIEYWKGEHYISKNVEEGTSIPDELSKLGDSSESPTCFLWGDSHAMAISPGIHNLCRQNKITGIYDNNSYNLISGFFLFSQEGKNMLKSGNEMNNVIQWLVQNKNITTVIMASRWGFNAMGCGIGRIESSVPLSNCYLQEGTTPARSVEENLKFFEKGLRKTCQQLKDAGKQVILFSPIPEREYYTPDFYWRLYRFGLKESKLLTNKTSLGIYYERQKFVLDVLNRLQDDHLAIVIDAAKPFLEGDGYVDKKGDVLLYLDDDHLSPAGAVYLIDEVKDQIIPYLTKPHGR